MPIPVPFAERPTVFSGRSLADLRSRGAPMASPDRTTPRPGAIPWIKSFVPAMAGWHTPSSTSSDAAIARRVATERVELETTLAQTEASGSFVRPRL